MSKDYVPDWNYVDAVRELFQNALDQETLDSENKMFFKYDPDTQVLSIGNKSSVLDRSSLLLGSSTKTEDDELIGQFGEGYKIATLVLIREDHPITIYNYGAKEVWKPRFVNSRRYGTQVLTFFIDKKFPWQSSPNHDLIIEVENITKEQYESIVESNLHLQDIGKHFVTDKGNILVEDKYKGKLFINGLFVCDHSEYEHGYDFNPRELELDRDRKLVSDFDLKWLASQMWLKQTGEEMRRYAVELVSNNSADVNYISSVSSTDMGNYKKTADDLYRDFRLKHGSKAFPVSTQEELQSVSEDFKPVMVTMNQKSMLNSSSLYIKPVEVFKPSAPDRLEKWLDQHKQSLSNKAIHELESIIKELGESNW